MKHAVFSSIIFFVTLFLSSCSETPQHSSSTHHIRIDPKEIQKIKSTDLFSEIRHIVLKTPEGVHSGDIDNLYISGNTILILDTFRTRNILAYDLDGNYLFDISRHGYGPGEIRSPYDIAIDADRNRFLVYDAARLRIIAYHLETGRFLTEYPIEMYISSFRRQGDDYVVFQNNTITSKTDKLVVLTDSLFNIKKQFLDIPEEYLGVHWHRPHYLTQHKDVHYLARPYDKKVYRIDQDSVFIHTEIEFTDMGLPDDFLASQKFNQLTFDSPAWKATMDLQRRHANGPWSYYETDRFIFTEYFIQNEARIYFYDKRNDRIIHTSSEAIDYGNQLGFPMFPIAFMLDQYIVCEFSPSSVRWLMNQQKSKMSADEWEIFVRDNKEVFTIFEQGLKDDQHILVFGKLRL